MRAIVSSLVVWVTFGQPLPHGRGPGSGIAVGPAIGAEPAIGVGARIGAGSGIGAGPGSAFAAAAMQAQTALQAGVARVELDPPLGMPMAGYGSRTAVAQGVLDPLQARALVLGDGRHAIALVTLDLANPLEAPEMERIRQAVRPGVEQVIFCASHTHSGPAYAANPDAYNKAVNRIQQAITVAARMMTPVRIGTGWGAAYLGYNRRRLLLDGRPAMLWRDEARLPYGPADPTVGVIRLDRAEGLPLAILVNYACHPVVLGADNLSYSADYPGAMRAAIEEGFGRNPTAFFLQGGAGDINPYHAGTPLREDAAERLRETGQALGAEALRVARAIRTETPANPAVQWKTVVEDARSRWDIAKLKTVLARYRLDESRAARLLREQMALPVTTVLLNREIALVTMPGEPFVDLQTQLRARSPLGTTWLVGYTDGAFGYLPTIRAAAEGGYGANSTSTQVETGTGERLLDTGIVSLYELLGRLAAKPAQPERYVEARP